MNDEDIKVESIVNMQHGQEYRCKIGKLHTDNGTEYKMDEMRDLLQKEGIKYDPCFPYHKQHNAISERLNLDF